MIDVGYEALKGRGFRWWVYKREGGFAFARGGRAVSIVETWDMTQAALLEIAEERLEWSVFRYGEEETVGFEAST